MRIDTNNRMVMVRGETEQFTVAWPDEPFETGDTVHFSVCKSYTDNPSLHIAVTEFTQGEATVEIAHDDTAAMDVGEYIYDVRVVRANGTYKSILCGKKETPAVFVLVPEVTK